MMRTSRISRQRGKHDRRGVLLVILLACIVIVALLSTALLNGARQWRRQVRYESYRMQAEWLADSGLMRALAKRKGDSSYSGEVWKLKASDGLRHPATISIKIENETIRVTANYETGVGSGIRVNRTLNLEADSGANAND